MSILGKIPSGIDRSLRGTDFSQFLPIGRARRITRTQWKKALNPKLLQQSWNDVEAEAKAYRRELARQYSIRQEAIRKQEEFKRVYKNAPNPVQMLNNWSTRFNKIDPRKYLK